MIGEPTKRLKSARKRTAIRLFFMCLAFNVTFLLNNCTIVLSFWVHLFPRQFVALSIASTLLLYSMHIFIFFLIMSTDKIFCSKFKQILIDPIIDRAKHQMLWAKEMLLLQQKKNNNRNLFILLYFTIYIYMNSF